MWDHALHLVMIGIGVAAFFVVPTVAAVPIFAVLAATSIAMFVAVRHAVRLPRQTGNESLIGDIATVVEWHSDGSGLVRHKGELWRAEGSQVFALRTRVRIAGAMGTLLQVQPAETPPGRTL